MANVGRPKGLPKTGGRAKGVKNIIPSEKRKKLLKCINEKQVHDALQSLYDAKDFVNYLKYVLKLAEITIGKAKDDEGENAKKQEDMMPNEIICLPDDVIATIAEELQVAMNKQKTQRLIEGSNEADIIEELAEAVE